ncbi:MAG TPA: TetR/AcrR family transcriptional regulator [Solirubrobacteraceae bacterium]|jgi:AcrR family transcriptional regulator|nr:TetR/AcrR family transcriptional regulator [Solirubrobacteraceae bacterium]
MPPRKPIRDAGGAPPGKLAPGMRLSRELVTESQRERLTSAMLALVDAQGFAGTSLADLIAQAHVPRDAFYRHYGSMEVCFQSAYNSHFAWGAGQVISAFNAPELEHDRERAAMALAALSEFAREWPAGARVCVVDVLTVAHGALEARAQELAGMRALLDAALGSDGPQAERAPLLTSAVLGGMRWAAYVHLRKRPRRELPRLGEELYEWIRSYADAGFTGESSSTDSGEARAIGAGDKQPVVDGAGAAGGDVPEASAVKPHEREAQGPTPGTLDFPGEEPRERILRAVVSLAAASDGEDCTYPKIAAAAGVSHDTFYKHFSSRQEAQLAACEGVHERLIAAARRASAAATDWPTGVRDSLGAYLAEAARDPQATRVMVLDSLSLGEPGRKFLERRARALKQLLRPALAATPSLPDAGAEMLVGAILEVLYEHALERRIEQLPTLQAQLAEIVCAPLLGAHHAPAPAAEVAARRFAPDRV